MTRSLANLYIYCHEAVWCFFHKRHPKLLRWMVEVPKELCRRLLCRCIRCSNPHRKDRRRIWRGGFYWYQLRYRWQCENCDDLDFYWEMKAYAEGW